MKQAKQIQWTTRIVPIYFSVLILLSYLMGWIDGTLAIFSGVAVFFFLPFLKEFHYKTPHDYLYLILSTILYFLCLFLLRN